MVRPPITVHTPTPLPPLRHYIERTITITPEQMDLAVGEAPKYDPSIPQEQELARWIGWSAKRKMADELAGLADKAIRETRSG